MTYAIYYNNTGSTNAYSVVVTDTLPENVTFLSSSVPPSSVSGRTYVFNLGTVVPGLHSFIVTVRIDLNATGALLVNWAFLNYTAASGYVLETSSASATVAIPEFGDLAPIAFVAAVALGLGFRHRTAAGRSRGASANEGVEERVADSVPDADGR